MVSIKQDLTIGVVCIVTTLTTVILGTAVLSKTMEIESARQFSMFAAGAVLIHTEHVMKGYFEGGANA